MCPLQMWGEFPILNPLYLSPYVWGGWASKHTIPMDRKKVRKVLLCFSLMGAWHTLSELFHMTILSHIMIRQSLFLTHQWLDEFGHCSWITSCRAKLLANLNKQNNKKCQAGLKLIEMYTAKSNVTVLRPKFLCCGAALTFNWNSDFSTFSNSWYIGIALKWSRYIISILTIDKRHTKLLGRHSWPQSPTNNPLPNFCVSPRDHS